MNQIKRILGVLILAALGSIVSLPPQVAAQATYDAPPRPYQAQPAQPQAETNPDAASEAMPETEADAGPAAAMPEEAEASTDLMLGAGFVTDAHLQDVFLGKADPNLDDLRHLQQRVNDLVKRLRPAVVGIRMTDGQGSGVIVTSDGYILTAAHVVGQKGLKAQVVMPDGSVHPAVVLGTDSATDSGMLRLLDKGPWPYVSVGESSSLLEGQWVMALGHPGGFDPNRNSVVRVGRMLIPPGRSTLQTDCTLVGGDSGGPLFDLDGYVIGIHSRISRRIQQNYHVSVDIFTSNWDDMAADPALYFGFSLKSKDETDQLIVSQVDGPVARAGMQVGDQIIKFNGQDVSTRQDIRKTFEGIQVFDRIKVVVRRKVNEGENKEEATESETSDSAEDADGTVPEENGEGSQPEAEGEKVEPEPEAEGKPSEQKDSQNEGTYKEITLNIEVGAK